MRVLGVIAVLWAQAVMASGFSPVSPGTKLTNVHPGCRIVLKTDVRLWPGPSGAMSAYSRILWGHHKSGDPVHADIYLELINRGLDKVVLSKGDSLILDRVQPNLKKTYISSADSSHLPDEIWTCDKPEFCRVYEAALDNQGDTSLVIQGFAVLDSSALTIPLSFVSLANMPLGTFMEPAGFEFECVTRE